MRAHMGVWWFRVWLAVFTAVMLWAGLTAVHSAVQANRAVAAVEADTRHDEAARCVAAWEAREDLRDMGEESLRGGATVGAEAASNALVQIGVEQGAPPQPGVRERFSEILAQFIADQSDVEVARVRSELPNPDCDLDEARERLGG